MRKPGTGTAALAVVAIATVFAGRYALLALAFVLCVASAGELFRLARARGCKPVAPLGLAGIAALLVTAHLRGERAPTFFPAVIAAVVVLAFVAMIARKGRADVTRGLAYTLLPVMVVGMFGGYVVALRGARDGFRVVLVLVAMTIVADVAPVAVRALLRRGAHAREEPGWQRHAAAFVGTLGVGVVAAVWLSPPFSWARAIPLAAVVAALVPVAESVAGILEHEPHQAARPRRANVLRAVDATLVVGPVFFYAFRVLAR